MAGNNPGSRNWTDVQMVLAALAMTLTVGLWNVFAGPETALAKQSAQPTTPPAQPPTPVMATTATALPQVKIMLGGMEPQTVIVQQTARRNNGGGGGGGGGSAPPVTNTHPS